MMSTARRLKGIVFGRVAVVRHVLAHPLNRGSRTRALRDYFLWNAVKFTMDARHVLKLTDDLEIILGPEENYGSAVYTHNLADYGEMLFLAHLLRPGDVFLDIGANVGMYSVWVAGVTGANCLAFEPVPETYGKLLRNIRLNALESRITPCQMAAGEATGTVLMTASQGGLDHVVTGNGVEGQGVEVRVGRVDGACSDAPPVAMKIDVEGFEMHALRGASDLLANPTLKAIIIELQDWTLRKFGTSEAEVKTYLTEFGFQPYSYSPEARLLAPADSKHTLNEIFVRDVDEVSSRLKNSPTVRFSLRRDGV